MRPSAAVPYELRRAARSVRDRRRFEIVLEARNANFGKAAAGAPFHVYTPAKFRGDVKLRTRAYAVASGDRLTDAWELRGFESRPTVCVFAGRTDFYASLPATRKIRAWRFISSMRGRMPSSGATWSFMS